MLFLLAKTMGGRGGGRGQANLAERGNEESGRLFSCVLVFSSVASWQTQEESGLARTDTNYEGLVQSS